MELFTLHHKHKAVIGVRLVSDSEIAQLNRDHLGHKGPTDVITFDLGDGCGDLLEGELAISLETARIQSLARGHDVAHELALYCVHGALHLLGFRDDSPPEAARMHALEDQVLSRVGAGRVFSRPVTKPEFKMTPNRRLTRPAR